MSNEIQFLKLLRRGYDPDTILQSAWEISQQKMEEKFQEIANNLLENEEKIENQENEILALLQDYDITKEPTCQVKEFEEKVKTLKMITQDLIQGLSAKKKELGSEKATYNKTMINLDNFINSLKNVPHPDEEKLLNFHPTQY